LYLQVFLLDLSNQQMKFFRGHLLLEKDVLKTLILNLPFYLLLSSHGIPPLSQVRATPPLPRVL